MGWATFNSEVGNFHLRWKVMGSDSDASKWLFLKMESGHLGNRELEKYHCEQQVIIIIIAVMKWFLCDTYWN